MPTSALEQAAGACTHGYAVEVADVDCPRCGEGQGAAPAAMAARMPHTRWHKTETTLGPVAKIAVTLALVVPPLLFLFGLSVAREHPENAFLVVPLCAFIVINVHLLPALWEPGRRPPE